MSRFRFRLAAPLRLVRIRQRELRRRLADELRCAVELERAQADVEAGARRTADELRRRAGAGISGSELGLCTRTLEGLRRRSRELNGRREELERRLAETRRDLAAVGRRLRVLERLEREAHRAWRIERLKREQRELDDLALVHRSRAVAGRSRG